jgi:Uma2 family endonuclease
MTHIPFYLYTHHEQDQPCEWVDGTLQPLPPLSVEQQRIQHYLLAVVGEYVEMNELGMVIPGPFIVRMPEEMRRGREPDLLYLPNDFVEAIQDNYVNSHGVGLVVEIADAATQQRDRGEKFLEYQMAGIPEYWLFDVEHRASAFYVLQDDNRYHSVEPDDKEVYHSTVIKGLTLHVQAVWNA